MDFTPTSDQELLRDTARSLLTRECPISVVRSQIDDPAAAEPLWHHLREFTELGTGPLVELCVFLEECGAVLAPGPFFASTALYAPVAVAAGTSPDGQPATVDLSRYGPGLMPFTLEADRVTRVAVVTADGRVALTDALPATLVATLDLSRRQFEVAVPDEVLRQATAVDPDALRAAVERATVALAAEMLGSARRLLAMAIDYAKERVQFDRPIGSFQAIQHKLANMALAFERAWSAVYYAAMCVDADDPDRHRAVHVAKASAGVASTLCAKDAVQIHGGIGFTWEHDIHLFVRRAYGSEALLGTRDWHHDRLGELLLA